MNLGTRRDPLRILVYVGVIAAAVFMAIILFIVSGFVIRTTPSAFSPDKKNFAYVKYRPMHGMILHSYLYASESDKKAKQVMEIKAWSDDVRIQPELVWSPDSSRVAVLLLNQTNGRASASINHIDMIQVYDIKTERMGMAGWPGVSWPENNSPDSVFLRWDNNSRLVAVGEYSKNGAIKHQRDLAVVSVKDNGSMIVISDEIKENDSRKRP